MKSKFYILTLILVCSSFSLIAQDPGYNSMLIEDWVKSSWRNLMKSENKFNAQGLVSEETVYEWDTVGNVWIKMAILTSTFNTNSTIAESLTKGYDIDEKTWSDVIKMQYTYDASKNVTSLSISMFMGTDWIMISKTTNEYNTGNQLTKATSQMFDYSTMQLKNIILTTYTYNSDGTMNKSIQQSWNSTSGAWENSGQTTYTYNAAKKVTSSLSEDYSGSAWVNDNKNTYSYNTDNTTKEILEQTWKTETSIWINEWKNIYSYLSGNTIQILAQTWNATSSQWVNESRITYNYTPTSIKQNILPEKNLVRVYPNPFRDKINIEISADTPAKYQIFNMEGQIVFSSTLFGNRAEVNLGTLKSGTYFLKMEQGNRNQTVIVVKSR